MEKKAICLLTRILRSHGISNCSAETFRLAKHDQIEAVVPMWNLLKNMIENIFYRHHKKRFDEHCNNIPVNHNNKHHDTSMLQVIRFVQHEFHKLGYESRDFYQLSQDDGSSGSRDLLLAFAWLMSRVDFADLILKMISSTELLAPKSADMIIPMNETVSKETPALSDIIDCVKHMILYHGKLTFTCRQLHALQREHNRLIHKLHILTQGTSLQPSLNHLTPAEARILHTNEDKLSSQLEDINSRIKDILKWKESENAFWKWMESVVMLKSSDSAKYLCDGRNRPEEDKITDAASLGHVITADEILCLQEAKNKLNETIIQCGSYINDLERVWHKKQPTLSSKEHSKIILDFHTKVKELDASNIENVSRKKFPFVNQTSNEHDYCFDSPKSQLISKASAVSKSRKLIKKKNSLEEDIVYLNGKNVSLQRKFQMELDSISDEFQHLICIPVSN